MAMWGFPQLGVPQKLDGEKRENHVKMDDLGVPPFVETSSPNSPARDGLIDP